MHSVHEGLRHSYRAKTARPYKLFRLRVFVAMAMPFCSVAFAGPPYVTDDPEPTELGRWEDYAFISGAHEPGQTSGQTGLDLNYGAARDLQLTVVVPVDYSRGADVSSGIGNFSLGAKYRFVRQSDEDLMPDISLFPSIGIPSTTTTLESHHPSLFLPLWAQKDLGEWSTFGGGGVDFAPGTAHTRNYLTGWALTRNIGDDLNLGVEMFHQTPINVGDRPETNIDVGVIYRLSKNLSILGSAGPNVEHGRSYRELTYYTSLEVNY